MLISGYLCADVSSLRNNSSFSTLQEFREYASWPFILCYRSRHRESYNYRFGRDPEDHLIQPPAMEKYATDQTRIVPESLVLSAQCYNQLSYPAPSHCSYQDLKVPAAAELLGGLAPSLNFFGGPAPTPPTWRPCAGGVAWGEERKGVELHSIRNNLLFHVSMKEVDIPKSNWCEWRSSLSCP